MPEYICKADIEQRAIKMYGFGENKYVPLSAIEHIPAADVAPVVHGRWVEVEGWYGETIAECSACGADFVMTDGESPESHDYHYCPNCGAKMDGEATDAKR